jgi:hypothetical protein
MYQSAGAVVLVCEVAPGRYMTTVDHYCPQNTRFAMGWPGNNASVAAAQFDYERSKNGGALRTNCDALRATRDYYNYLTDVRSD